MFALAMPLSWLPLSPLHSLRLPLPRALSALANNLTYSYYFQETLPMSNPSENTNTNESHDGFVWSQYIRVGYALVLAAVVAFALAAPALAAGAVGFGK
jgi:hypothetical protein